MGLILRQLEKAYKSVLFRRHDSDGSIFYFTEADFPGLIAERFNFKSKRGHLLSGNFYHYGNPKADRLVVFEHGMGNGHIGYFREIEMLARQGYLVYSYDHTGCSQSEGEHIHGLSGSLSDLDDCITALTRDRGFDEDQISVVGHSWGGFSTLNILALHPNLHSVVAVSGFISIPTMHSQLVPFSIGVMLYDLERRTNPDFAHYDAMTSLKGTDKPVLVIHSTDDATVSYKRNFFPLSVGLKDKTNIDFLTVSGSGHNPFYTKDAFAYKEAFFKALKAKRRYGRLKTDEQKAAFVASYDWHRMTAQNDFVWSRIFEHLLK